ncbi:BCCT family transporter [Thiohalorhabdus sp.]|uniref:BCCT family transporter n=1 Tax=Thiohalorhabdus sp. TaxID=3094134 RepID=UPI002FC366A8
MATEMPRYVLRSRSGKALFDVNPYTFFGVAAVVLLFVVGGLAYAAEAERFFGTVQATIANNTGWFFVLTVNVILAFVIGLIFTRWGRIRLGGPDAEPEFGRLSWFTMLFSAGMGIGLMFYGVAEPLYHLDTPPVPGMAPGSSEAAQHGMGIAFLHWGLHPWGIYALMGLTLAFYTFNRGLPLSLASAFYPFLGDRIYGPIGVIIDILASVATLFGVATSLGLGVQQLNGGLNYVFGVEMAPSVQVELIVLITVIATVSVVTGVHRGVRRLSETNLILAGLLTLFVLVVGPSLFTLNAFVENLGYYLDNFFRLSSWNETYSATDWQNSWTVFYWGWWIAWSPFVGMFIARISRGRTMREFILGVLLAPTVVTFLWFTVFGDTALQIELFGVGGLVEAVQANVATSLFAFLEQFPMALVSSVVSLILVAVFFVTSSDSGSLVIDIITSGGQTEPPTPQRVFWAVTEGVVAIVLLLGGGLVALQTAAITAGLPLAVLLLLAMVALVRGLRAYVAEEHLDLRPEDELGSR